MPTVPMADLAEAPPAVDTENKENTPPDGSETPTRDEISHSSQGSLPCSVGILTLGLKLILAIFLDKSFDELIMIYCVFSFAANAT